MLIAEIRGKRNPSLADDEDYLTSSVFGHLRHVSDQGFWKSVFERATSPSATGTNLYAELVKSEISLPERCEWNVDFWPTFAGYGEPDLLLSLRTTDGRLLLLLIEVKLNSGKSGSGSNDQLARYFRLIQDTEAIPQLREEGCFASLIYLTLTPGNKDLRESLNLLRDPVADHRMFAMQWQDLLEAALSCSLADPLLGEVAQFLRKRKYELFKGFQVCSFDGKTVGNFYSPAYFRNLPELPQTLNGDFYDRIR